MMQVRSPKHPKTLSFLFANHVFSAVKKKQTQITEQYKQIANKMTIISALCDF